MATDNQYTIKKCTLQCGILRPVGFRDGNSTEDVVSEINQRDGLLYFKSAGCALTVGSTLLTEGILFDYEDQYSKRKIQFFPANQVLAFDVKRILSGRRLVPGVRVRFVVPLPADNTLNPNPIHQESNEYWLLVFKVKNTDVFKPLKAACRNANLAGEGKIVEIVQKLPYKIE